MSEVNIDAFLIYLAIAFAVKFVSRKRMTPTGQYVKAGVIFMQGIVLGIVVPDEYTAGLLLIVCIIYGGDLLGELLAAAINKWRLLASMKRAERYGQDIESERIEGQGLGAGD